MQEDLARAIRNIPDFPRPGIQFKDLTPLLADAALFRQTVERLSAPFRESGVTHVVGMEARGFWFGPALAQALSAGFIPARKPGKLPAETLRAEYALEYGTDAIEIHADAFGGTPDKARVLVHDDVIATGGTAGAVVGLIERAGATVVACSFVIELDALNGRDQLPVGMRVESLVHVP
jgi:adenine phosphoribosyltransferase